MFICLQTMPTKYYEQLVKVGAFASYSVKIRVIFDVRFERRKVDKKAHLHEN